MRFFDYDNGIMTFLSKVINLAFLNVLTIIFSLPLITIGAATTAAHYTALKIHREEGYVWSCFWKSFKENFKQSTVIWLIIVIYGIIALGAYLVYGNVEGKFASVGQTIIMSSLILLLFLYAWIMPLQSKFINTIRITFKNSFYMANKYFFRTLLMSIFSVLPVGLLALIIFVLNFRGVSIWLLLGISLPIYWCALLYDKIFEQLEEQALENQQQEQIDAE